MNYEIESIRVDFIEVDPERRALNEDSVVRLVESIKKVGLRTPITVRIVDGFVSEDGEIIDGQPILVTGAHRLEAVKRLGWEKIDCFVMETANEIQARLWEIAENLHRAELTAIQRDEHVAEWIRLTEESQIISAQSVRKMETPRKRGRPTGGVEAAARELGINRQDARRAIKVASLSDEAKEAAREVHLDDNRSALLEAAKADTPEKQVEIIREIAEKKATPKPQRDVDIVPRRSELDHLIIAWNNCSEDQRWEFLRSLPEKYKAGLAA